MLDTADHLRLRWIVNSTTWRPGVDEFAFVLTILPTHEREEVTRFHRFEDRKRALLSRLMQRAAIKRACASAEDARWRDARVEALDVRRTKGSKPFHGARASVAGAPNFNYNVSHEGDYVVLASETYAVVGVDVAAPGQVRRVTGGGRAERDVGKLLETFSSVLTDRERASIAGVAARDGERAGEELFRKHWSLKEAHVKAIGVGLGMDLRRCEFDIDAARSTASVSVDGKSRNDWSFHMQAFPPIVDDAVNEDRHWITVSRGPVEDIVDADGEFTETTFSRRDFSKDEWSAILAAPAPSFELLTVGDLIPIDSKDAFEAAGGVIF